MKLLFPSLCFHCRVPIEKHLFCEECLPAFDTIDPLERCSLCFRESEGHRRCSRCRSERNERVKMGAAWEARFEVTTFLAKMQTEKFHFLTKSGALMLSLQLSHLNWPSPDLLIAPPALFKQSNATYLVAKHLSKHLHIPLLAPFLPIQHRLKPWMRKKLVGKRVLLINDTLSEKSELQADFILNHSASTVYVLALAVASHYESS